MIVEVPVIQPQGKAQQVVNTHGQRVVDTVEVEKPKIIELTVQRKKPIIQEKINQVNKPIEFPQAQFLDKAGDMPVVVQRQVSTAQTVQKAMEVPPLQSVNRVVDVPVVAQGQIPVMPFINKVVDTPVVAPRQIFSMVQTVQKTIETQQLQCIDKVIDVPVQLVAHVPRVEVVEAVEIPQFQAVKKIGVIPETLETSELQLEGTQTSESLNTAFLRRVTQAEIATLSTSECGWSANMQLSTQQRNSSQAVASNTCKQHDKGERKKEREGEGERGQVEKEKGQEERERGERGKREEETEEEGKDVREETDKEVKKDVTDWVEVRRRTRRKSRKMIQIFVKVDGGKTSTMEIEMSDKVDDIVKKIPISERDVYVTSGGRTLRRSDKRESCEVRDGSTVEVTSRMRGGGKHKEKKQREMQE